MNETTKENYFNSNSLAYSVWEKKYKVGDETPDQTLDRISGEFDKRVNKLIKKSESCDNNNLLSDDFREFISYFKNNKSLRSLIDWNCIIPGGSGINGIGNDAELASLSNCFVIGSPHDSLEGINYSVSEMNTLAKRRGGVGLSLDTIRPRGAHVNNQSKISDGVTVFAEYFSNSNNSVAQNARRGALMLTLSVEHPDCTDFVQLKNDLKKVTGANLSVVISDEFMTACKSDKLFIQRFPITTDYNPTDELFIANEFHRGRELNVLYKDDNGYFKIINPKMLWNDIIHYAHKVAEPGLLFKGNWEAWGLDFGYDQYRPLSTNPCSEIPMQPYDSCRLLSVNLLSLIDDKYISSASYNATKARMLFYIQMILGDILVDMEIDRLKIIIQSVKKSDAPDYVKSKEIDLYNKILNVTKNGRRCGAGFMGLGDTLAALGLGYNIKSSKVITKIMSDKLKSEFKATVDLAIICGSFEGFDIDKEKSQLSKILKSLDPKTYKLMCKYGRRNVSWSTAAPTGTISMLAGVSSGIEPVFLPWYKRRVKTYAGDKSDNDFVDVDGNVFKEYNVYHPQFIEWVKICFNKENPISYLESLKDKQLDSLFKKSPWYRSLAGDLKPLDRIEIQSIVQKYTTHSISSTINLTSDVKEDVVSLLYEKAWLKGLKGLTVYRDGSRAGVIVSQKDELPSKRPDVIRGVLHQLKYRNKLYGVLIGLVNDKPYEIFILSDSAVLKSLDSIEVFNGFIKKHVSNIYSFEHDAEKVNGNKDRDLILYDLDVMEDNNEKLLSLTLSKLLRSNVSLKDVIKLIRKSEPIAGTFTFRLIKILSSYIDIEDNIDNGEKCPNCDGKLTSENGCVICKHCGWSKC